MNIFLPAIVFLITASSSNVANSMQASLEGEIAIEDIVQFREFSGLDICLGNSLIAARVDQDSILENRTHHTWHIIEWPSGKVRLKADAGEAINSFGAFENVRPQWSPDCQWIYYRALQNGEVQIWRLNTRCRETEKVTSDGADVLWFELAENGRELVYKVGAARAAISAAEAREYNHGVLYDESIYTLHPPLMRTYPVAGRWGVVRRWNDNTKGHLLSRQSPSYKVLEIADRTTRIASESEISAALKGEPARTDWIHVENAGVTISPSGDRAVVKSVTKKRRYDDPLVVKLVSISRNDPSKIQTCSGNPCKGENIGFLKWSDDGSTLYFISEQARGVEGIYSWTPETEELRTVVQTEGDLGAPAMSEEAYSSTSMPCPIMGDIAFCTAADHGAPPRLLAIDLQTSETKNVFDPNAKLREKFNLRTERIRWKDGFNREALGFLVYPRHYDAGERYPLVITAHDCRGFLEGGSGDGGPEYALAERGFFALCVNASSPYPPKEETLKYSLGPRRFVAMVSEYETAIDMLAEKGFIDERRVGITGMSRSSRAVSYMLTHTESIAAAATRALGVISAEIEMLTSHPTSKVHATLMRVFNIDEDGQNRELIFNDLAMTRRANRVEAPILVQASESEYLINLPAIHALLKLNKPVEMHIFPDETHFLHQPIHRYVNFTRNLDWFRFWLQNYEDPDPEKAEQYARWRKMRDEQCERLTGEGTPSYCRQ